MFTDNGAPIFSPYQVGALRIFIAALVLLPFSIAHRRLFTHPKWHWIMLVGLIGNGIPAFLFTAAETKLSTSFVGILNSLTPIFTLIIAIFIFKSPFRWLNLLGLLIAFIGTSGLIQTEDPAFFEGNILHTSLVIIATLCYAISVNIIHEKLKGIPPLKITSVAFGFMFIPAGTYLLTTDFNAVMTGHSEAWAALGYTSILAIIGTAFAVVLFTRLIAISSGVFGSTVTYLIPVFAVLWGIVEGETITWLHVIWMLLIFAGILLVNRKKSTK